MRITEAAMAQLAKLAEQGAQAPTQAKKAEPAPVEEAPAVEAEAEETPAEGE